jgi:hypothetical protein
LERLEQIIRQQKGKGFFHYILYVVNFARNT